MKVPSRIDYERVRGRLCRIRSAPPIFCHDRVEAIIGSSLPGTRAVQNLRDGQADDGIWIYTAARDLGKLEDLYGPKSCDTGGGLSTQK